MNPIVSAARRHRRFTDAGLRGVGLAALAIAALAFRALLSRAAGGGAAAVMLAGLSYLGASIGSALFILGAHILDEVQVSERWAPRSVGG